MPPASLSLSANKALASFSELTFILTFDILTYGQSLETSGLKIPDGMLHRQRRQASQTFDPADRATARFRISLREGRGLQILSA
jgi:hypothetical protein